MKQGESAPSVWERSRQMASQEIHDTAIRLFTTQGYEETTTEQIAREAGVSQRTLFRYFGSKEDLVCGEQEALGALLTKTVQEQPAQVSAWDALRTGFGEIVTANHSMEQALTISTLVFRTPALRARYEQKRVRWQYDLMPVVRSRLCAAGRENASADHEARTVIAVSFACSDAATGSWIASQGRDDLVDLYDQALAIARTAPMST
ncbi:TetR family transcriptional regulator [Streptomyces sp. SRF1]|uniref:TetR/AcrR family transcriptional regulator n=1 Tax=Streptomyces sp. SRF1 TaxID=1549642 RepID=UPI0025AF47BB|nr:TetR/AcrR family transcriptional regulator [Streptomyces sp. SRF1]MDN3059749.1 TetR family transcriptional regulator [Streptomyces sp. SRF1]